MSKSLMEKFSVIIVSWNVADSLRACLKSIFSSRYSPLEVIVVDNASTDASAKVAKEFKPAVRLIQNTKNLGFPKALNIGLRQSGGDYLVVLNPDTKLPQNFFTSSLQFFAENPDAFLMGPKFLNPDGTVQGSVFNETSILNVFKEFWLGQSGLTAKYSPDRLQSVFAVSGACMVFPRSTLERVGLFTEKVFMYFEDMDYCRRIHALNGKVYFNPSISIIHEHGKSSRRLKKSNPIQTPFWKGHLWESSLWYNGHIKHYLMAVISWTGQKLHSLRHK